ncbi:hypothetical protein R3P38DRAFT_2574673 [Favolaschia claudopus]|uniref:Uncharacterized protein n=1 Tax=Favolaschia claudopus TaxID=2862362 RepID=A0AAV9ZMK2_9AGAR
MNSNNWTGGRVEVSMMREFHRAAKLDGMGLDSNALSEHRFLKLLLGVDDNVKALGTIQDAAAHGSLLLHSILRTLSSTAQEIKNDYIILGLRRFYSQQRYNIDFNALGAFMETYNYFLLDGRRIASTQQSRSRDLGSCLVWYEFEGEGYAGEVDVIFRHKQTEVPNSSEMLFVFVRWMKRSDFVPMENGGFIWDDFPELGVETWKYKVFAEGDDGNYPPCVLPADRIKCQVARGLFKSEPRVWVTTTMDRVSINFLWSDEI